MEPADELVLLLSRKTLTPADRDRSRRILSSGVEWTRVLDHARDHEVSPMLYRNLEELGFPGVPEEAKRSLEALYKANAIRAELLSAELTSILRDAHAEGLSMLPFKGPGLAKSLYGDVALRFSIDLDILVPPDQVSQGVRFLERRGYAREGNDPFFDGVLRRTGIEYLFQRHQGQFGFLVELHWGVLWPPALDDGAMDALWRDVRNGALSPEWEFLVLAVHAARHSFQGLKWLVDLYERGLRGDIDWSRARDLAAEAGWEICLRRALAACRQLFGVSFAPEDSPPLPGLFPAAPSKDAHDLTLALLDLMDRPSARLQFLMMTFLMPTLAERRAVRFPRGLEFLYYPFRPLRLGVRWITAWRRRSGSGRS